MALALLALLAMLPACVQRKMFIRSEPPGASVMIDGRVVGTTPMEQEFLSYGQLRVDLELEGHDDLRGSLVLDRPWWQHFPVAFVADLLTPWTITDEISFDFVLEPAEEYTSTWEEAQEAYERMKQSRPNDP